MKWSFNVLSALNSWYLCTSWTYLFDLTEFFSLGINLPILDLYYYMPGFRRHQFAIILLQLNRSVIELPKLLDLIFFVLLCFLHHLSSGICVMNWLFLQCVGSLFLVASISEVSCFNDLMMYFDIKLLVSVSGQVPNQWRK